jgi:hypothetical protein
MLEARDQQRREEDLQMREQERQAREQERQGREQERQAREQQREHERRASEEAKREWNRERGEIARKLGTVVEDIVAPSVPRVVAEVFGLPQQNPLEHFGIRMQRWSEGERHEFDAVAAWPGYFLINETRSKLRPEEVPEFIETLRGARRFFPEYHDRKLVGALASLYLDPTLIRYIERQGIIVMGLGDDLMDAKNSPGFRPTEF